MKQIPKLHNVRRPFWCAGLSLIIALWLCPTLTFACSSDATPGLIDRNRVITQGLAVLSIALLVATVILYFKRQKKGLPVIFLSLILVVFHPAWFYGGGGGDCGMSMVESAELNAAFLGFGVAYQLIRWQVKRHGVIERRA